MALTDLVVSILVAVHCQVNKRTVELVVDLPDVLVADIIDPSSVLDLVNRVLHHTDRIVVVTEQHVLVDRVHPSVQDEVVHARENIVRVERHFDSEGYTDVSEERLLKLLRLYGSLVEMIKQAPVIFSNKSHILITIFP